VDGPFEHHFPRHPLGLVIERKQGEGDVRQDHVVCRLVDRQMKPDVVFHTQFVFFHILFQLAVEGFQLFDFLIRHELRSLACRPGLQGLSDFQKLNDHRHVVADGAGQRISKRGIRERFYNASPPVLHFDKAHRLQRLESFPQGRSAHGKLVGHLSLRREDISRVQLALLDQIDDLFDDSIGKPLILKRSKHFAPTSSSFM